MDRLNNLIGRLGFKEVFARSQIENDDICKYLCESHKARCIV